MAADFTARGLASAETSRARRLRILDSLARSMDRVGMRLPRLSASPPTIAPAGTPASAIADGTTWLPSDYLTAHRHDGKYSFVGGAWRQLGSAYPQHDFFVASNAHNGNGSDPAADPIMNPGARVRFATWAPRLEIYARFASGDNGFRLKVDSEYVHVGVLGNSTAFGDLRFIPVTWGDGSAANRKLRFYELEYAAAGQFGGIRTAPVDAPEPWLQAGALRVLVHGDSMVSTYSDIASPGARLVQGTVGSILGDLLGQPDCWASSVGATGWTNDFAGTRSTFGERLDIDVIAYRPDVIVETGGLNDSQASRSTIQREVESWLARTVAALPDVAIFMTGPLVSLGAYNTFAPFVAVRDAKRAAAARFPRNVAFIDNMAEEWVRGSGRVGATTGDGNADWVRGVDGTHPALAGAEYFAQRIARGVAAALPQLARG